MPVMLVTARYISPTAASSKNNKDRRHVCGISQAFPEYILTCTCTYSKYVVSMNCRPIRNCHVDPPLKKNRSTNEKLPRGNFPANFPVNFTANFPGNSNFRPILRPIPRPFQGKYSGNFNFTPNFPATFPAISGQSGPGTWVG